MKFYHGTTKENWEKIKKEGVLRGIRKVEGMKPSRCTYLAVDKNEAKQYGDVVLEVEYEPKKGNDNYVEGCWQVRVYEPIPIENCKVISEMEHSEWERFMRDRADKSAKNLRKITDKLSSFSL